MDCERYWRALRQGVARRRRAKEQVKPDGLEEQDLVATAIQAYLDGVDEGFRKLLQAQEQLVESAFCRERDDSSRAAEQLLMALRTSLAAIEKTSARMQIPLETHRDTIRAAAEDLQEAETAHAELSRYRQKVAALGGGTGHGRSCEPEARVVRNQAKLEEAELSATAAHTRAEDAARACRGRAGQLRELGQEAVSMVVEHFGAAAAHVAKSEAPTSRDNKIRRPPPLPTAAPAATKPLASVPPSLALSWPPGSARSCFSPFYDGTPPGTPGTSGTRTPPSTPTPPPGTPPCTLLSHRAEFKQVAGCQGRRDLEIAPVPTTLPQTIREGTLSSRDGLGRRSHLEEHFRKALAAALPQAREGEAKQNPFDNEDNPFDEDLQGRALQDADVSV